MVKITNFLIVVLTVGMPLTVHAQPNSPSNDRAYCAKLSELYVRYIGHDDGSSHRIIPRGANKAQVASTQCEVNTAWAIPVLERQLAANKFTLPTRD
jgi:hypothetical protein